MAGFFTGTPGRFEKVSTLRPGQEGLYNQLQSANAGRGAGGSFGTAADYYRDLLSNDNDVFGAFEQPELRRFREQTIPNLSEQFAGMGSGGLSSSGFRNAAVNAGTDLSERLAMIRAQLRGQNEQFRQNAAHGLTSLGQQGLQSFDENIYRPATSGFLENAAPAIGGLAGSIFGPGIGELGSALGTKIGNWLRPKNRLDQQRQPLGSKFGSPIKPSIG